jgi:hypothetical protein
LTIVANFKPNIAFAMGRGWMTIKEAADETKRWVRLDEAAFGIIYGSVTALALLIAMSEHPDEPLASAATLFGSILAIALATAFADIMSIAIETGERITRQSIVASWHHSRVTLVAANLPTLFFVAAFPGWWSVDAAVKLSQLYCTMLLVLVGARVGWRVDGTKLLATLGGAFAFGVGLSLALLKYVLH